MSNGDIYQAGAEVLWGSGEATAMGGAVGEKAGWQARQITENLVLLKNKVNANSVRFPREYTDALQQFINSWQSFLQSVSGTKIPWYDFPRQAASSFNAFYNRAEIYNQVQIYGAKYKQLWDLASLKLGEPATMVRPPEVNKPISENPVADAAASVVKGVLIIAAVGVGGYALINWFGAPKRREVVVVPEGELHDS
jgi:hypothetical protein